VIELVVSFWKLAQTYAEENAQQVLEVSEANILADVEKCFKSANGYKGVSAMLQTIATVPVEDIDKLMLDLELPTNIIPMRNRIVYLSKVHFDPYSFETKQFMALQRLKYACKWKEFHAFLNGRSADRDDWFTTLVLPWYTAHAPTFLHFLETTMIDAAGRPDILIHFFIIFNWFDFGRYRNATVYCQFARVLLHLGILDQEAFLV
jgi:hypothetical protein